ncbi:MAG: amidohydrolase family protein [Acidobacteriota bacterium]
MAADALQAPRPSSVLLYGGTVLCLDARRTIHRQCEILVQRGVIASMGRSLTIMPGTRLLDVSGRLVIPGLIGVVTQLAGRSGAEAPEPILPPDPKIAAAAARAGATDALLSGVTTVCDVGTPGASAEVAAAVRSAIGGTGLRAVAPLDPGVEGAPILGLAGLSGDRDELAASTIDAAAALGLEAEIGSVELGKWADLVVLTVDADVDSVEDEELFGLVAPGRAEVQHVLVAGSALVSDGVVRDAAV